MEFLSFSQTKLGSSLLLPPPSLRLRAAGAHGRAGSRLRNATDGRARATSSLATHFAKRNTKFGGGEIPTAERFAFTTRKETKTKNRNFTNWLEGKDSNLRSRFQRPVAY